MEAGGGEVGVLCWAAGVMPPVCLPSPEPPTTLQEQNSSEWLEVNSSEAELASSSLFWRVRLPLENISTSLREEEQISSWTPLQASLPIKSLGMQPDGF